MLQTATAPERRHACLVEDDPDMRGMLERFLCQHGFRVTALEDAEALLERVRRGALSPDAIVLDQSLPGMTGREACQWLRREGHQVPVLMLSASDDEIDRVLGLELGADDFVGKPFSARELLARLNALIRRAQGGGPAAALGPPVGRRDEDTRGRPPRTTSSRSTRLPDWRCPTPRSLTCSRITWSLDRSPAGRTRLLRKHRWYSSAIRASRTRSSCVPPTFSPTCPRQ